MPKLVITGQSPAVYSAIRTLRASGADWAITLVSTDGELPYDRGIFPGIINRRKKEKDSFCAVPDFYKDNKVEIILGKEISRINFNRRKIFLSDRFQLDYDALLMTDAPQVRLPEVKGMRRQGVFHFARIDALRRMIKYLLEVETVIVIPSTLRGIEMALAFKGLGKEVILVSSFDRLLPAEVISGDLILKFGVLIEKSGLRVMLNNSVEDILGEGSVQAVRFKSGKVIACEMVVVEDARADLRFLAESELLIQERICVHTTMQSNIPNVYAADAVMELASPKFTGSYSVDARISLRQGECAAKAVLGEDEPFQFNKLDIDGEIESIFPIEILARLERGVDEK